MRLNLLVLAAMAAMAGCASMADSMSAMSGIGRISEETSTFDNARIVRMTPAFLYGGEGMMASAFKLGARWSSDRPDQVALLLMYEPFMNTAMVYFDSLQVNIDGEVSTYTAASTETDLEQVAGQLSSTSQAFVRVPLELLDEMLAGKDVRLRINTTHRYEDAVFSVERIPGGQATAIIPLREFASKVRETS